jgi:hypothetical protein
LTRPVSAVLAAFTLLLLAASPAGAQFDYDPAETTYDQAAADYPFPVYEPTRGIRGMGFRVSDLECADDVRYPYASYGYARDRRGTRPRFSIWQSRRRVRCGDGRVVLCRDGVPFPCIQQWYVEDTHALAAGQRSRLHGFECLVEAAAVTCTIVRGAAKGRGFTISLAGASEIVPP